MPLKRQVVLAGIATATVVYAAAVAAHGLRPDIRATVSPPEIAGLHVELHQGSIAPQLVLENRSGKVLELSDSVGQPFLRFDSQGVWVNLNSVDARRSLNPGGAEASATAQALALALPPKWKQVRAEPSYGWFDPRLTPEGLVPPKADAAADSGPIATWSIPASWDGQPTAIQGAFLYRPPAAGVVRSQLLSPAQLAAGLRVSLAPGAVPALFLDNRSEQAANILDDQGRAFLRIGPGGVWADTSHPLWLDVSALGRNDQGSGWQQLSTAQRYTWLEPRAAWQKPLPGGDQARIVGQWQVPLRLGDQLLGIVGRHVWVPKQAQ